MAGLQRPHQTIEEAAAAGQTLLEQSVHLRCQPNRGNQAGDVGLIAWRRPVQAENPAVRLAVGAGTDAGLAVHGMEAGVDRPPAGTALARQVEVAGAAQASARDKQRKCFQQVGLAAAVRAIQHTDPRRRAPGQRRVVAEVGQGEAVQTEHRRNMAL
jgi:hypothetical protein